MPHRAWYLNGMTEFGSANVYGQVQSIRDDSKKYAWTDPGDVALIPMERTTTVDEDKVVLAKDAVGSGPMRQGSVLCGM